MEEKKRLVPDRMGQTISRMLGVPFMMARDIAKKVTKKNGRCVPQITFSGST